MTMLKYLPVAMLVLSLSAQVRADDAKTHTVAQAPRELAVSAPCLLNDLTSLTRESDFTVFMDSDCPDVVRNSALRKLWQLMPASDTPTESSFLN